MLRKLIKYELLADWKKYGIAAAALLLISIMLLVTDKFSQRINNQEFISFVSEVLGLTFGTAAICAAAMMFVFAAIRFYKSFIQNEGYLTHTLPVHTWQLIASRLVAIYVWFIGLAVILMICAGIVMGKPLWLFSFISDWSENIDIISDRLGKEATQSLMGTAISGIVILLLIPGMYMARIFLSFALGNLFSKNKFTMSIVMFFVISFAERILSSIISFAAFSDLIANVTEASAEHILSTSINALQIYLIFSLIFTVGSIIASERIFAKRLNLE